MKLKSLALAVLLSVSSLGFAQYRDTSRYCDTLITRTAYKVLYSQSEMQPKEVDYIVTECTEPTKASRKGIKFIDVRGVRTSTHQDYAYNEYDKGHMAPAAAFSCYYGELLETFQMINIALQIDVLNRGPWKHLESRERALNKKYGDIKVHIVVDLSDRHNDRGVNIPRGFWKTLNYVADGKSVTEKYYFPNDVTVKGRRVSDFKLK